MSDNKVVDIILHCQKQIKKERLTDDKLLHYLGRLSRLRVTVQDLADTGIGRTVNSLSRNEGPVGQAADTLVRGWKRMVSEQQSQTERESEDESDSGSSEEEEEDEEPNNEGTTEPYDIDDQEESQAQDRHYSNGHGPDYDGTDTTTNDPPSQPNREYEDEDDDVDDDIDDPYMENGYMDMSKVQSSVDEDDDNDGSDESDRSERLEIDADEDDDPPPQYNHNTTSSSSFNIKQERQSMDELEQKRSHSTKTTTSSSSSGNYKSHGQDPKKPSSDLSSSKSHRNHDRSREKTHSKEHKHYHHHSSSKDSSKERTKHSSSSKDLQLSSPSSSYQHKSHHSSSSSKSEKSKEFKSESDKERHHKEKDKHRSKETSSSHRGKEKERENLKSEKDRSSKEKKDSSDYRSSSSSISSSSGHKNKIHDPATSTHSPKKSSLDSYKKEPSLLEDRKRKDHSVNSPSESSANKKSKLVLKEEIDSNSGINFADVLGSLDATSGSASSKQSSSKKEKRKDEPEKSHRKHHESHHISSSSSRKHDSFSKSSSSKDAGSSYSSKKQDFVESEKLSKKPISSKIESVIQPVVNISPNYKPMSTALTKVARPGSSGSSISGNCNGNGIAAPPPVPLSHADLSDLGSVDFWDNAGKPGADEVSQEDAISSMLSNRNRNARSKVFSGAKSGRRAEVSSLYDLCMQVIKDNIGELGFTGGIPYEILKPALERANPQQLMNIESQNDYLIGETDELWQFHCKRDFRGKCPSETESWRELYERCTEERQLKFEVIKKQMKRNIEKAEPVRKAKLAYVDTSTSTRFNHQKAQTIKNGMKTLKIKEEKGPSRGVSSSASAGFNNPKKSGDPNNVHIEEASVIIAPESRAGHAPAPSVSREVSAAKFKPKKAPLMQKTMKLIKSLHRR